MKYYVAHFRIEGTADIDVCRDIVAALAAEAGFEAFEETADGTDGYVQQDHIDRQRLDALIDEFPVEGAVVSYTLEDADYRNWNETWENAGYDPIAVGDRCLIHDPQHPTDARVKAAHPDFLDIVIEARQAFGTGTHETTRMMVAKLLEMDLQGRRVLDCGCGTGILGIAASKLGADEVVGYDIDEWSVNNARHNAQLNNVTNMHVWEGNSHVLSHVSGVFDVVVANINRNVLLDDMHRMKEVMAHGARLIMSGFYVADGQMLAQRAGELGLSLVDTKRMNDWCLMVFDA